MNADDDVENDSAIEIEITNNKNTRRPNTKQKHHAFNVNPTPNDQQKLPNPLLAIILEVSPSFISICNTLNHLTYSNGGY